LRFIEHPYLHNAKRQRNSALPRWRSW
jgi:hypothetical protein